MADIIVATEGRIGWITIDRPEFNNAVRPQTLREICGAIDALETNAAVRVIILTGAGRHFCAGAELAFLETLRRTSPVEIQSTIYAHFIGAARRLYRCGKPTVAAVSGAAVTVGCELALAADFRVVSETARFQESWIKLGLVPPLGGMVLLPATIGLGRAKAMALRGDSVRGPEAVAIGLAHSCHPDAELRQAAIALAEELAALPPLAYAAAKEGLHRGLESTMDREWAANAQTQSVLLGTADFAEGLNAVQEKRSPKFGGR